jgi:hypothetical protein
MKISGLWKKRANKWGGDFRLINEYKRNLSFISNFIVE